MRKVLLNCLEIYHLLFVDEMPMKPENGLGSPINLMATDPASYPNEFASDFHRLASLVGVLNLRWHTLRSAMSAHSLFEEEMMPLDATITELRAAVQLLNGLANPPQPASGIAETAAQQAEKG